MPRVGVLPHKHDKRGQLRGNEVGKVLNSEVEGYDRMGPEGNSWRSSNLSFSKDVGNERNGVGVGVRPSSGSRDVGKDSNKYVPSPFRDDDAGKRDFGRRDGQGGKQQPWNNVVEPYGDRNREPLNRNRADSVQSSVSRSSFSLDGKRLPVNDPLLNFGREKRALPKGEKGFMEDPFMKDFGGSGFDGRDLFSGGLVGVVKKKKDVPKQTDFHDPVRESFEAELERVQRMQEQERQRIIEEQERVLELARREEEERLRQAREQEEAQRRLEEEAREAAWRAEQERIEALRKAEEQRLAREEEKQRILLEEDRRKQAAKQKLLELEQRIARRQAEGTKSGSNAPVVDEKMPVIVNEKEASRATDVGDWEDSERMVDRILTSASSDSSSVNRPLEMGSRSHFSRDLSSTFVDRGKPVNSWRRDAYESWSSSAFYPQDQENSHHSPRRDLSMGGKPFMRKEYNGGGGFVASRTYYKGGISEPHLDEYAHVKPQRWNQSADGDHLSRNTEIDSDFHENIFERFGDGWTQGRSRGNPFPPFPERTYPNSESDGPYALGRSRYSVRQPRVLPPPSLGSVHRTYKNENEHPGPSAFLENEMHYNQATRSDSTLPTGYDNRNRGQPEVVDARQETTENDDHKVETTPRCDSQSSLSVSSPPSSPTHLSHDDLDDSGDSPTILTSEESKNGPLTSPDNESIATPAGAANENIVISCAVSSGDDDEWTTENNEQFQEQEEYDEDEDYQEEDEVHEGDDNAQLNQDFEDMHLQEKGLPHLMDNLVLGFDEGVQVGMPNEEFERTLKDEETTFMAQQASGITLDERVSYDNACDDDKALQPVDDNSQVTSSVFLESEKPAQDLVIQPSNSLLSVVSESLGNVEASNGLLTHHSTPSSVTIAPHYSSGKAVTSNVAAAPSQAEVPMKLQFGLFSGPSLIPSPVPAIQIGSIQMPLHLHPQVGAPLSHMHPSQPPLFQFGQLRYTSPISQGIMPLGPQSMSFVQPNVPSSFSYNHNPGGQMPVQTGPETSDSFIKNEIRHHSVDSQPGNSRNLSQGSLPSEDAENIAGIKQGRTEAAHDPNNSTRISTSFQLDKQGNQNVVGKSSSISSSAKESEVQPVARDASLHSVSKENFMESKTQFPASGGRGKRYVFTVKNSNSRSSGPATRVNRPDSGGFMRRPRRNMQRTEFRVRESAEKRQSTSSVLTDQFGLDIKSNINGRGAGMSGRTGPRKAMANKLGKQPVESATENSHGMDSGSRAEKVDGKVSTKTQSFSHSGQSNLKRNLCSEEDVDAPLQSGIIRVFEQPGIEAPSDEDDFIEVRSKRQMLIDRREQREKEIKAKSRVAKVQRRPRSASQSVVAMANSSKGPITAGEVANSIRADYAAAEVRGMTKIDASSGFNSSLLSQALPPIGTPPLKIDAQPDLRSQISRSLQTSLPAVSGGEKDLGSSVIFESKNKVLDNVQTSLGSWGNAQISQQVMTLTQTQLDEAMKPQQFDSQASVGNMTGAVNEPSLPTSSILTREKSFSSAASPINSLLAGEKIQFGAVTSPTVLPSSSRVVSHGIGPPRSSRSDMQINHNLTGSDNDCSLFFDKEKHGNESHGHLEDCDAEAEAEAAASAVAVAAISSDEIVGNGLSTCSVPASDGKSFVAADIDRVVAGVGCEQQSASQSRSEEPLSVSLPADLSVETPPISLWPPLPSTQNSSGQMISHFPSVPPHFPSGHPSHFPFYEMNPMMGGPVFAFGPHDESVSTTQSQPQKSTTSASRPIGSWQQCHSGVESFYGPPTGFTGPFIAPPGGIPGVQGPPHMVVYNHFAPVGQFGQVGLSFMGTTYIPSGKQQPDWKHIPTSSAAGAGEGDMNNMNMASSQRNPANMPSPIQHLAPGSPLMPMASPVAMFDVSPFQPSTEMSVQARWPHVPNSQLPSIPLSMPLQQQEGVQTSQFSHGPSVEQPLNAKRFTSSRASTSSDGDRNFPRAAEVNVNQLPDELGLVDTSNSTAPKTSAQSVVNKTPSVIPITDAMKVDVQNGNGGNSNNQNASSSFKGQPSQQVNISSQQSDHSSGHTNYQRGGVSQRNNSGGEWSHRRGYQGRNQSLGADKNFSSTKVKQIYVAKQTISGGSTVS
ncbi:Switch-associated protein 70 [Spatholobus suberectus]|nr:Switch-associated protein 70 [Spatholobus suberectus]